MYRLIIHHMNQIRASSCLCTGSRRTRPCRNPPIWPRVKPNLTKSRRTSPIVRINHLLALLLHQNAPFPKELEGSAVLRTKALDTAIFSIVNSVLGVVLRICAERGVESSGVIVQAVVVSRITDGKSCPDDICGCGAGDGRCVRAECAGCGRGGEEAAAGAAVADVVVCTSDSCVGRDCGGI